MSLILRYSEKLSGEEVEVEVLGQSVTGIKAQEILKKVRSTRCFFLHNSTVPELPFGYRRSMSVLSRDFSPEYADLMDSVKETIDEKVAKIAKSQEQDISNLLGRLREKYSVRLAFPKFDPGYMPVNLVLGGKGNDIPLGDWGSGTQNRTRILLTLFRAKQISEADISAAKVTPVIVIEEPESFLHPSAQAEFGRVLQDLSNEFDVQVIVTTHSPYMLSLVKPSSNTLLERHIKDDVLRATHQIDISGDNWMEPFSLALGIDSKEFEPWKKLLFSENTSILLVEGKTDKEYFDMLLDETHGSNRLRFDGDIFPYGGYAALNNTILLRFIKNRYKKLLITYDLDAEQHVEQSLKGLGFKKNCDYFGIGLEAPGKKRIEGLVPSSVTSTVTEANPDIVSALMDSNKNVRGKAANQYKKLLLAEFKSTAVPGCQDHFSRFYELTAKINDLLD
jgi:hypothetical protein